MERLKVEGITKSYSSGFWRRKKKTVLSDIHLSLRAGQTLGLIGMSGSGKSTLAKVVMGLIQPDEGKVFFEGADVTATDRKSAYTLAKDRQILFQQPASALNPRFTMADSMREPLVLHPETCDRHRWDDLIDEQLAFFSLSKTLLSRFPHQLSGGQLQRFALARLLLLQPKLLILDEPTSMLDVSVQAQVMELLSTVQKEKNLSYLFITHDIHLAAAYCNDIAVMGDGKMIECRRAEDLYLHPRERYTKDLLKAITI